MAAKRKRGSSWEYIVKRKGVLPKPISLTFRDEAEGDAYVAHLEKLLAAGIVPGEFRDRSDALVTLGQALRLYVDTVHITDDDVRLLAALDFEMGSRPIDRADYPWAEAWVQALQASGLSPSTIRKKVGALARCLDWVVRRGGSMLAANPLRMLPRRYATTATGRKDVERDRRLHDGEEPRIMAILNREKPEGRERALALPHADGLRLMFTLALETAMRMREIYTLGPDQVDLSQRTIFLDKTKNGDKRQVPLSSVAVAALAAYLSGHHGDKVFLFWDGDTGAEALRSTTRGLSAQWRRIFSAAGCVDLHFHDLRHEATSRFYERTKLSDIEISRITGHKDLRTLRRYSNLRGSNLAEKLW
jgi:integrase